MSRSAVPIPPRYRAATEKVLDGVRQTADRGGMSLKSTRVLVIGGTSGIGLGVATAVAERGATPIVASRRQSSVDGALAHLPEGARGATVDLTDEASLKRLVSYVGDIDHLVFTAGESLELTSLADL